MLLFKFASLFKEKNNEKLTRRNRSWSRGNHCAVGIHGDKSMMGVMPNLDVIKMLSAMMGTAASVNALEPDDVYLAGQTLRV